MKQRGLERTIGVIVLLEIVQKSVSDLRRGPFPGSRSHPEHGEGGGSGSRQESRPRGEERVVEGSGGCWPGAREKMSQSQQRFPVPQNPRNSHQANDPDCACLARVTKEERSTADNLFIPLF